MLDTALQYGVEWLCGGIAGAAIWLGRALWVRQRQSEKRQLAIEQGLRALLRDRIVQSYYHYAQRDWVTLHGLENINVMYAEYHNLGGNGIVSKLVEDVRKLDVRSD